MKRSLTKSKLFGIKEVTLQTVASTANVNVTTTKRNNYIIEETLREAERKKAEAITILRRYTIR
jgi:hypothetical protein